MCAIGLLTTLIVCIVSVTLAMPPIDLGTRITKPTCVDIPSSLELCLNIGYTTMRMPNLLDHDSLNEVRYQSRSWIPLLLQRCHSDTQLFLCSLFAPVCLDRPIYPCRSLCQAVRDGCEPLMQRNCFNWPPMLECSNFPEDNDLCIKSEMLATTNNTSTEFQVHGGIAGAVGQLFTQCHSDSTPQTIFDYSCNVDFVLKMRINGIRDTKDGERFRGDPSKVTVYKQGSLRTKDLKKLNFYVREGTNCRCEMLQPSKDFLLVMGHRQGKLLFMTYVHSWSRDRNFRSVIRDIESGIGCPILATTIAPAPGINADNSAGNNGEEIPPVVLFPNSEQGSDREPEPDQPSERPRKGDKKKLTKAERRQQRRLLREQEEEMMRQQEMENHVTDGPTGDEDQ